MDTVVRSYGTLYSGGSRTAVTVWGILQPTVNESGSDDGGNTRTGQPPSFEATFFLQEKIAAAD